MKTIFIEKVIADKPEFVVCWYVYLRNWINKDYVSDQTQDQFLQWSGLSNPNLFTKEIKYNGVKAAPRDILTSMGVTISKIKCENYDRYIYQFKSELDNFFYVDKSYINEIDKLGVNKFAFLLKLKAICLNGTNTCLLSKSDIAERLQMSRTTLNKYLSDLSEYVSKVKGGFEIIHPAFRIEEDPFLTIMKNFAAKKGSELVKPDKHSMLLLPFITGKFDGDYYKFITYLYAKFKTLPSKVSVEYFNTAITKERVNRKTAPQITEVIL